jgi:flagellar biosynthesis component FlhA
MINFDRSSDFTLLPVILLVLTVGNMASCIATIRLILTSADTGTHHSTILELLELAFAGNRTRPVLIASIVGITILFSLITIITVNGTKRLSKIAIQFLDDAKPFSLNQKECDFYRSMDGAAHFIIGAARVIVAIVAVNISSCAILPTLGYSTFSPSYILPNIFACGLLFQTVNMINAITASVTVVNLRQKIQEP